MVDGIEDFSLEKGQWKATTSKGVRSPLIERKDWYSDAEGKQLQNKVQPLHGELFAWFGGYKEYIQQEMYLPSVTIPEEATHLSFFVFIYSNSGAHDALHLLIDDQVVFYFNGYKEGYGDDYRNMDVDIRKYADGRTHSLMFRHYGVKTNSNPVVYLVDVIHFIRDENCL